MKKFSLSRLARGAMIAVTLAVIATVFVRNMYPSLQDMIVLDDIMSANRSASSEVSSLSAVSDILNSLESCSDNGSGYSDSGGESCFVSGDKIVNGKININTASVSELMTLSGIGETRAKAIVEYRSTHGAFSSIDDLVLVNGIGEKTLEKNRDLITV